MGVALIPPAFVSHRYPCTYRRVFINKLIQITSHIQVTSFSELDLARGCRSVDDLHAQLVGHEGHDRVEHGLLDGGVLDDQWQQHHHVGGMDLGHGLGDVINELFLLVVG